MWNIIRHHYICLSMLHKTIVWCISLNWFLCPTWRMAYILFIFSAHQPAVRPSIYLSSFCPELNFKSIRNNNFIFSSSYWREVHYKRTLTLASIILEFLQFFLCPCYNWGIGHIPWRSSCYMMYPSKIFVIQETIYNISILYNNLALCHCCEQYMFSRFREA